MTTKEELLRLLEEDNEFRLTVAGFLGYGEILKRLEKHKGGGHYWKHGKEMGRGSRKNGA